MALSGPTAVGKSTVGWWVYQQLRDALERTAFVDLDQVGPDVHRCQGCGVVGRVATKAPLRRRYKRIDSGNRPH